MSTFALSLSRWIIPLFAALVVVGLAGLLPDAALDLVTPATGLFLLVASVAWYWQLDGRVQPEALPKLRIAGLSALVLLLALMYGLLVGAIALPEGLARLLYALFLGVAAAALLVGLLALVDLALLTRQRWARYLAGLLAVGYGLTMILETVRAHADAASGGGLADPVANPYPLALLVALLALVAPMEWVVALDRRQRLAVLVGWLVALAPLVAATWASRLLPAPHQHLLTASVRVGAILGAVYVAIVLARATLALPGARAYERKVRELDAVYDFGLTAGTAFNPEELQTAVVNAMLRVVEPDVALVVEADPEDEGCSCVLLRADNAGQHVYRFRSRAPWSGLVERFADRRPLVIVDHKKAPPGAFERIWEPASGSSVIVPVIPPEGDPRAVLIAGRFEEYAFNTDEVRSLAGFANQVGLAMDHARLLRETVQAERRKRELEIARELQVNLLPREAPDLPGLDIAARSEPATEVGGDYFDYLELGQGRLGIAVGDVSGHGMPAGLLMAMAKSSIYTQVQSGVLPSEMIARLSETLLQLSADNQFMTMVLSEIDLEAGEFRYSNAGHHYPFHLRAGTGEVVELESTGLPLGMLARPQGPFRTCPLGVGDILVFYSDGIVEATDPQDEMFGLSRLRKLILANHDKDAKTIVEVVFRAVRAYTRGEPLDDDATIVVVRVTEK